MFAALASASVANVRAQEPPGPDEPWFPPEPSVIGGYGGPVIIPPSPGPTPGAVAAWMTDYQFNRRDHFSGSESMYLFLSTPFTRYILCWYEYYPPGNIPRGHWITRWVGFFSGTVAFGPFPPEPNEPYGLHVERLWLVDVPTRRRAEALVRWYYDPPKIDDIITTVSIFVSTVEAKPGQQITITASLAPLPSGGTLTVQMNSGGGAWVPIQSASASSGSLSVPWNAPSPGTYLFQGVYDGYQDTSARKKYLPSTSSAQTVRVQLIQTTMFVTVSPTEVSRDILTGSTGSITVTCTLSPAISGALVSLAYSTPAGDTMRVVAVGPTGSVTDSFTPSVKGTCRVTASFPGDQTHVSCTSQPVSFEVKENYSTLIVVLVAVAAVASLVLYGYRRSGRGRFGGAANNCAKCGRPVKKDWKSCPYCGSPLKKAP